MNDRLSVLDETSISVRLLSHIESDGTTSFGVDLVYNTGQKEGELILGNCGYADATEALKAALLDLANDDIKLISLTTF